MKVIEIEMKDIWLHTRPLISKNKKKYSRKNKKYNIKKYNKDNENLNS